MSVTSANVALIRAKSRKPSVGKGGSKTGGGGVPGGGGVTTSSKPARNSKAIVNTSLAGPRSLRITEHPLESTWLAPVTRAWRPRGW